MAAAKGTVRAQIVALALSTGSVSNADVQALLGCSSKVAGSHLANCQRGEWLEPAPTTGRMRWRPTAGAAGRMPGVTGLLSLRVESEKLAQKIQRIAAAQAELKVQRAEARRAALDRAAIAQREAVAQRRAAARARLVNPGQPGSRLVAAEPHSVPAGVVIPDHATAHARAKVQDPQGLLARASRPADTLPAAPGGTCPGGGLLRPHGPYIRPTGQAHLNAPSRRGEALVAHRPPLSQP